MERPSPIYRATSDQALWFRLLSVPCSRLYRGLLALRQWAYDRRLFTSERLPGACLSVGNLVVGGTGKSPIVMSLASELMRCGARVVILSRGYGSNLGGRGQAVLRAGKILALRGPPTLRGADEAMMQSQRLPAVTLVLGARRSAAAHWYLATRSDPPPTHWILDDGFQHRRLHRDCDLVLLDAKAPFGNGELLPAGSLRERPSALARAHVVFLTKDGVPADIAAFARELCREHRIPVAHVPFRVGLPRPVGAYLDAVAAGDERPSAASPLPAGTRVFLASAIARPDRLLCELKGLGLELGGSQLLADHASVDRARLVAKSAGCQVLVTSEKDYWRDPTIFQDFPIPVYLASTEPDIPAWILQEVLGHLR